MRKNPGKSGRIRNNPKEYERIWPNFERIGENSEESEKTQKNGRESY